MTELEKDIETFKKNSTEENNEFVFKFLDQNYSLEDVRKFTYEVLLRMTVDRETYYILNIISRIKNIEQAYNEIGEYHQDSSESWEDTVRRDVVSIEISLLELREKNKKRVKKYINKLILKIDDYTYQEDIITALANNYILDVLDDNTLEQYSRLIKNDYSVPNYEENLKRKEHMVKIINKLRKLSKTQEIDTNSFLQIKELISELTINGDKKEAEFTNEYVARVLLQKFYYEIPMITQELEALAKYYDEGLIKKDELNKKTLDNLLSERVETPPKKEPKEETIVRGTVSKLKSFFKSVPKQIVEFKEKYVKEKPQNNSEETPKITSGPNRNDLPKVEVSNWIKNMYDNKYKYGMGNVRRTIEQAKKSGQNIGVSYNMEWLDYGMEENERSNKHR